MDSRKIQELAVSLEKVLQSLRSRRDLEPFENDAYETLHDILSLTRRAIENDGRVDFHSRAEDNAVGLHQLCEALSKKPIPVQALYGGALQIALELNERLARMHPEPGGFLGVLSILDKHFSFLTEKFRFKVAEQSLIGRRYESVSVYVELQHSSDPVQTCCFGTLNDETGTVYWLDDLLRLYRDNRAKTIFQNVNLATREGVDHWFALVASVLEGYGEQFLGGGKDAFDRLKFSQQS